MDDISLYSIKLSSKRKRVLIVLVTLVLALFASRAKTSPILAAGPNTSAYYALQAGSLNVGNFVWFDADGDGAVTGDEPFYGIEGVELSLYRADGTLEATTTTDAFGSYSFNNLNAGTYTITISANNFSSGGLLYGLASSAGANVATSSDDDIDNNDDGQGNSTAGPVTSFAVTLTAGNEPATTTVANDTNLSVDFGFTAPSCAGSDDLGGYMFRDYNHNGVNDIDSGLDAIFYGENGNPVTVYAYDDTNSVVATTTVRRDGSYIFDDIFATYAAVRIEFDGLPADMHIGAPGADNGTETQIHRQSSCAADVGVYKPEQYCGDNPKVVTTCFIAGPSGWHGNLDTVVALDYQSGTTSKESNAGLDTLNGKSMLADVQQTGSVNGLAYSATDNTMYAAAWMKLGSALRGDATGTNTPGVIYRIDDPLGAATVSDWITLPAGNDPQNYGLHGGGPPWPVYASDAFNDVGRVGLADIDISADDSKLYAWNLLDRELYEVATSSGATLQTFGLPAIPVGGTGQCPDSADLIPGAVKWHDERDLLYVGITCTAEPLQAYVYELNPATGSYVERANFALDYDRGTISSDGTHPTGGINNWNAWASIAGFNQDIFNQLGQYPQPWLMDIEFDEQDYMIVNLTDRWGHQSGPGSENGSTTIGVASGGDILLLSPPASGATTWAIEQNGNAGSRTATANDLQAFDLGPGGREFYYHDRFAIATSNASYAHTEVTNGGLAVLFGTGDVVSGAYDPAPLNDQAHYATGGLIFLNNHTGERERSVQLYGSGEWPQFGKSAGFGDIELICEGAPLMIGNRVWLDPDNNGVQDPSEPGISGVEVQLVDSNGVVSTTTTDSNGEYYFDDSNVIGGLLPNSTYTIRIPLSDSALTGYTTTTPDYASDGTHPDSGLSTDLHDSDGIDNGTYSQVVITTGELGENDYTFDFGFVPPLEELVQIGSHVWIEDDSDGDSGTGSTTPVAGAMVTAIGADGSVYTATTDASGQYTMTVPANGVYTVTVGTPAGTVPSGTLINSSSNPSDADGMSHDGGGTVVTVGTEDNFTIDFGFTPEVVQIGSHVWIEDDTDGDSSTGSTTPVVGVIVTAIGADGSVYTATTDASGQYTMTVPANGVYTVTVGTPAGTVPSGTLITSSSNPSDADGMSHDGGGTAVTVGTEDNFTIDFGFTPEVVQIGSHVWIEDDTDGDSSTGSTTPVVGVIVTAIGADGSVYTATTDASGQYTMTVPANGVYTVTVGAPTGTVPSGTLISSSSNPSDVDGMSHDGSGTVVTVGTEDNFTIDFGFTPEVVQIGSHVWIEDDTDGDSSTGSTTPVVGAIVMVVGADGSVYTATTDANGQYTVTVPANGIYTVTVGTPAGTVPSGTLISSSSNPSDVDGMSHDGSGTVVTVGTEDNFTIDFGFTEPVQPPQPAQDVQIGSHVWVEDDTDGDSSTGSTIPVVGVIVMVVGADGSVYTATTDANGQYTVTVPANGVYTVTVGTPAGTVPSGTLISSSSNPSDVDGMSHDGSGTVVTVGTEDNFTIDFGFTEPVQPPQPAQDVQIGSHVWIEDDTDGDSSTGSITPVSGTMVMVLGADGSVYTTMTDVNGQYTVTVPANGVYTVTVGTPVDTVPSGTLVTSSSSPSDADDMSHDGSGTVVTVGTEDNFTIDFGYTPVVEPVGSIGNSVWLDVNGDGVYDASESGIGGVMVALTLSDGSVITTTTSAAGEYMFANLPMGLYTVTIDVSTLPAPYVQSYDADGVSSENYSVYSLGSGEDNESQDFGYSPEATAVALRGLGAEAVNNVRYVVGVVALVVAATCVAWLLQARKQDADA